jgi:hypothetical protein
MSLFKELLRQQRDNCVINYCQGDMVTIDKIIENIRNAPEPDLISQQAILIDFAIFLGSKYQLFHDRWTEHCENVYETDKPFFTTEDLIMEWYKSKNI